MNADILKRLIRAIASGSLSDLDRLAQKIVEAERKTGHKKLAEDLEVIFNKETKERRNGKTSLMASEHQLKELPLSRRYSESLATFTMPEDLEHHMILPELTERRFARIESEYAARDRLRAHGLQPRKTILLYGPPGCGKSLGAKRLAWSTGLPLLKVRFDTLISSYFGESAVNLRSVFIAAKELPCVLLLDECDFIARSRMATKDIGEAARIVNALLQLMEEYDAPGLLVATTNIESALDFAMFRRFDDVFLVPPPGPEQIEKLMRWTLSAIKCAEPIRWDGIVNDLSGESAAHIVKVARDAAKAAVLQGHEIVTENHLRFAVNEFQKDTKSPRGA
jgi:SpoVK/Ycf46/Vps4 family AAA+-type ATPase